MDDFLSKKIRILSFISMIMVLFVHSVNCTLFLGPDATIDKDNFNFIIQEFISFFICRIAVPFFFIVSAYFIAIKSKNTLKSYLSILKKRFHTLLIPYFLWVSVWTLFFYCLTLLPWSKGFINNPVNTGQSWMYNYLSSLINPICYQFWFIRDLLILLIFFPVLNGIIQKLKLTAPILLYFLVIFGYDDFYFFHLSSLLYFTIGVFISQNTEIIKTFLIRLDYRIIGFLWLLIYLISPTDTGYLKFLAPIANGIGLLFFWQLYDTLNMKSFAVRFLEKYSAYSFFLFAFHEPTLISLKKIALSVFGTTNEVRLLMYFLLPFFVFMIAMVCATFLHNNFSKMYNILVGGR